MSKWIEGRDGHVVLFQASTNTEAKNLAAQHINDGPVTIWKVRPHGWEKQFTIPANTDHIEFPVPAGVKNRGFAKMKALDPERLREVSAKAGRNSWAAKKAD